MQLEEIVNQGKLVSDEIIISLLSKRLEAGEANGESGFILDGFPQTVTQAVSNSFCKNCSSEAIFHIVKLTKERCLGACDMLNIKLHIKSL